MAGSPTYSGSTPMSLYRGLDTAMNICTQVKSQVVNTLLPGAQNSGLSAQILIGIPQPWISWITTIQQAAALSGMAAFAQAQLGITDDITVRWAATVTAIQNVVAAIQGNLFSVSTAAGQYATINPSTGQLVYATFTTTQLAGLVPLLQALQAALD